MRVGQNRKRDWNEAAIISALRAIGVTVRQISGEGVPDLLCHSRGKWLVVEVKRPRGKLTPAQRELQRVAPFPVVEDVPSALALFGVRT